MSGMALAAASAVAVIGAVVAAWLGVESWGAFLVAAVLIAGAASQA